MRLKLKLIFIIFMFIFSELYSAPKSKLWDFWLPHDESNTFSVDHSDWDTMLKDWVVEGDDGLNRVKYNVIQSQGLEILEKYIDYLFTHNKNEF